MASTLITATLITILEKTILQYYKIQDSYFDYNTRKYKMASTRKYNTNTATLITMPQNTYIYSTE